MSPRLSILAGLLVGIVVAALVLVAIVAFAPDPVPPVPQASSVAVTSARPSARPSAGATSPATPRAPSAPSASPVAASAEPSAGGAFHVGEPAPALVVPQVGGGTIDLAALRGKPVWVNFMATWCPPCQDEFPLMSSFASRYAEDGLVVVAVDVREEEGEVAAFAERLNATFPIGLDGDGSAQGAWDALALPVHFWIDADGIVRQGALGGIGPDVMAEGLRSIMPGVDVKP